jgi:hypothetical protein
MTMKQFKTASRRGEGAVNNPVDLTFEFEVREGEFVELTAKPPTTGQLALFFAHQYDGGTSSVRALFDFVASVLSDADYKVIENQLQDGLDIAVVIEIVQYLTEEWSTRPTKPARASSASRRSTGPRSTGKQLAAVSTTSPSASTGS